MQCSLIVKSLANNITFPYYLVYAILMPSQNVALPQFQNAPLLFITY